jgi:hypothetical protein
VDVIWAAIGAALIAAVAGLLGAASGGRREHRHWLRGERQKAYLALLSACSDSLMFEGSRAYYQLANQDVGLQMEDRMGHMLKIASARDAVFLAGPKSITGIARDFAQASYDGLRSDLGAVPQTPESDRASLAGAFIARARGVLDAPETGIPWRKVISRRPK